MKFSKLILSGFKSFADKTELEFDDGISCIVGPNGCGKSNVVDAVKWVLGEQSAKSLRGSEMQDVIFNGCASRRPAGGAEVTLVFGNADGLLQPHVGDGEAPGQTVSVTRRLFRSGYSEYLINNNSCRLRDVREMFMDTGNAYSLIEQGRVEGFLQASQEERRAVFDEAAGISKYKARRKETSRKLERVEQNLLRINDILGEVEKRLRSIKYQAGKARSYQVYSEQLKELRSLYFLAQYHEFSKRRNDLGKLLDSASDGLAQVGAKIDQLEAARSAGEVELVDLERTARALGGRIAAIGGQITNCQERSEMLSARVKELGEQIVMASSRCEALEAKIEEYAKHLAGRSDELKAVEASRADLAAQYDALCSRHREGESEIAQLQAELEDAKSGMIDLLRRTAELHNEIHSLCIRREGLHGQRDRLARRAEEIHLALENLLAERAGVQVKLGEVESVLSDAHGRLDETRQEGLKLQGAQESLAERLNQARERRSAVGSRIQALSEMQQRLEGVSSGVRLVLDACRDGRLRGIRGILGQFIQTDVEHAAVVEAALAGADQRLLADRLADIETAVGQFNEVLGENGAVEVLCMDRLGAFSQDLSLADCPRAIARVIDWVRFEAWLSPVVWRLLGRTLVTGTLSDAAAAARIVGGDFRFVTLSGEVLETDGRVRLGAARSGAGMIARRSELVDLESHQQQLESQINHLQQQQAESGAQREHLDRLEQKLRTVVYEATTERVECNSRIRQLDEQVGKLEQEKPLIAADRRAMAADIEAAMQAEQQAQQRAAELARRSADCQVEVERLSGQLKEAFQSRDQRTATMTELKVALGRAEEKERSIRESLAALTEQCRQMERDLLAGRSEIELARQRRGEAEAGIGAAAQEIESLYNQQQQLNSQAEELQETQRGVTERLEETVRQLSEQRKVREASANEVNGLRVQLGEADVRIENLIARAADEMGMSIPELYRTYRHDDARDWDAVAGQIKELRDKIERLGNINLDAIAEQDELQKRKDFLTAQLEDVRSSQNQLNELIRRINRESRQLFIETFEAVRGNFQELFRKLFGGGRADILLIDPEDVLESGIEIVARPPGKELRTLSLLSGGEKTMTALALLFSIFRARPSPFCLLDEVDAALDEPNTERFARLLQEFNQHSQFIIISHAKRTMSMASVLYGVTMQEPGVSKRISVRFEEVDRHLNKQEQPVGA